MILANLKIQVLNTIFHRQALFWPCHRRVRLLDTTPGFGEANLNMLVDEVRLDGNELHIKGSYGALARAVTLSRKGKLGEVPSFVPEWRPHGDSNPGTHRERVMS